MKKILTVAMLLSLAACASAEVVSLGQLDKNKDWKIPMYYNQSPNCNGREIALIVPEGDNLEEKIESLQESAGKLKATYIKFNNPELTSATAYSCVKDF